MQPPILVPFFYWWGDDPPTKQDPHFWRGVAGIERGDFFQGGLQFYLKNKLKSEIFNNKKKVKNKNDFSIITKNLNW